MKDFIWIYELRRYDSRTVALYVAMCIKDDLIKNGIEGINFKVFETRRSHKMKYYNAYGIKYKWPKEGVTNAKFEVSDCNS
jgi:hypothetical protein